MTSRLPLAIAGALSAALLLLPNDIAAAPIDRVLRRAIEENGDATVPVIVRGKRGKRAAVRSAVQANGNAIRSDLDLIDGLSAEIRPADIERLASDESVESISYDAPVQAFGESGDLGYTALLRESLGLRGVRATGAGVGVAVIDSGIKGSFDVYISAFFEVEDGEVLEVSPYDNFGHGSHVASLIGASGERTDFEYSGVAPAVHVIGLKVLDRHGSGRTSDVIAAIEFAVAHRVQLGIDVINLSLGHPIFDEAAHDPLVQSVEAAIRAGVVVVVAAGNCGVWKETPEGVKCGSKSTDEIGYAGITSPGNAPSAITVGASSTNGTATRADDRVAFYSSRGPTWYDAVSKPDLVAPGHEMIANGHIRTELYQYRDEDSNRPTHVLDTRFTRRLLKLSGTSMSAAVTTGIVALMIETSRRAHPFPLSMTAPPLTPNLIKAILQYTAIPLADENGVQYDELTQGVGGVNAGGAVAVAASIMTFAPVGWIWIRPDADITPLTSFGDDTLAWGQKIVWGSNLFSSGMLYFNDPAFAPSVSWGSGSLMSTISATGRNIVWGSGIVWDEKIVWGYNLIGTVEGEKIVWGYANDPAGTVWAELAETAYSDGWKIVWGFGAY